MKLEQMTMEEIWNEIDAQLSTNKSPIENMNASYSFDLTGEDGGLYGLKFSGGEAETFRADPGEVDCALKMSVGDFKKLLAGDLNSTAAFMMGKLKVKGNIGLALKLENLLKQYTF
jgi:putative sterol carrier protein